MKKFRLKLLGGERKTPSPEGRGKMWWVKSCKNNNLGRRGLIFESQGEEITVRQTIHKECKVG